MTIKYLQQVLTKKIVAVLLLVFTIIIAACSSSNEPEIQKIPPFSQTESLVIAWQSSLFPSGTAQSFVPVVDNNAIFTADAVGEIFRLDSVDGTIINIFKLHCPLSSGTATSASLIFVTTTDANLLALDKVTGHITWQVQLPTVAIEAPQVAANTVVVHTNDGALLAYNMQGNLLWLYQKPLPSLTLRAYNTFQIFANNDVIVAGQADGRLVLLNLTTGNVIWDNNIAPAIGATDLDKLTAIAMRPILDEKQIFVATYNGKITCIEASTGNTIWARAFSTDLGLIIDEQNIYAVANDGVVTAFAKTNGSIVWQNEELKYRQLSVPVFLGANILLFDFEGNMFLLNAKTGSLSANITSNLKNGIAYPYSDNNQVIVQTGNGKIAVIRQ